MCDVYMFSWSFPIQAYQLSYTHSETAIRLKSSVLCSWNFLLESKFWQSADQRTSATEQLEAKAGLDMPLVRFDTHKPCHHWLIEHILHRSVLVGIPRENLPGIDISDKQPQKVFLKIPQVIKNSDWCWVEGVLEPVLELKGSWVPSPWANLAMLRAAKPQWFRGMLLW